MAGGGQKLSRWYKEVAQQLAAGFLLSRAIVAAGGPPRGDRERMQRELLAGVSLDEVLRSAPRWLPMDDRFILSSAAESGRLAEALLRLSLKHAMLAEQSRRALAACIYPIFVIHFGALALPIRHVITDGIDVYLREAGILLAPIWIAIAIFYWGARRRHRWLNGLMRMAPFLRSFKRFQALADLAFTLEVHLAAGQSIITAWERAGLASSDRLLRRIAERIARAAREGREPGIPLSREKYIPEDFASLYLTGEQSGQLDRNLGGLAQLYSERASESLRAASFWYPKVLFAIVAIWVAYTVISFYADYLRRFDIYF